MVFLIEMMSYSDTNSLEDAIFVSLYSTDVVFGGSASFPLRCAVQAGALSPHKPRPTCRSARSTWLARGLVHEPVGWLPTREEKRGNIYIEASLLLLTSFL